MYGPRPIRFSAHWCADYSKYRGFLAGGISTASSLLSLFEPRLHRQNLKLAPTLRRLFPGPAEQFFKCGVRRPPLLKWGEGKEGQIELFSLCGCLGRLELSDYRTFLESRKRLLHKLLFRCHRSAEVPSNQLSNLWFDSLIKYLFIVFVNRKMNHGIPAVHSLFFS